jgi:hypothetical protein
MTQYRKLAGETAHALLLLSRAKESTVRLGQQFTDAVVSRSGFFHASARTPLPKARVVP